MTIRARCTPDWLAALPCRPPLASNPQHPGGDAKSADQIRREAHGKVGGPGQGRQLVGTAGLWVGAAGRPLVGSAGPAKETAGAEEEVEKEAGERQMGLDALRSVASLPP